MKCKTTNARVVWKQIDDVLVPKLPLSVLDRAAYCYLVRHSRLEGKARLHFSIKRLAKGIRVSEAPTRQAVRRLMEHGALRLVERTKAGHAVEVRLPEEIHGAKLTGMAGKNGASGGAANLEQTDFMRTKALRQAIHARERGRCFYCMRQVKESTRCIDHVVPRVQMGRNSYRNLVSCCVECNSQKGETPAKDYLRRLYREERLSSAEFTKRLHALAALVAGKLKPEMESCAPLRPSKTKTPARCRRYEIKESGSRVAALQEKGPAELPGLEK